jgi:xanthosine utilization system XapX-like protein
MQEIPPHATVAVNGSAPLQKITNGAIVTMGGGVLVWIAHTYFKTEIPAEVAVSLLGLLSILVQYLTSIKRRELNL